MGYKEFMSGLFDDNLVFLEGKHNNIVFCCTHINLANTAQLKVIHGTA